MWEDPIVAEVHATREKLAAEFDFDIGAFFADVRKRQASVGERLVLQEDRSETTADDGASGFGAPDSASSEAAPAA